MNFVSELPKKVRSYDLASLPIYSLDYLGFHVPIIRKIIHAKHMTYTLFGRYHFVVRPYTYDRGVIDEIFIERAYAPNQYFSVEENNVVVDIGAHIGCFTVFAASKSNRLYSYEPDPENFKLLKENLRLNNLEHKVRPFQLAVWGRRGRFPMVARDTGLGSLLFAGRKKTMVEAITLDDILDSNNLKRIDFLKVDVEEAEWEIFSSSSASTLDSIRKIALEVHSSELKNRLTEFFKRFGFSVQTKEIGYQLSYLYARRK